MGAAHPILSALRHLRLPFQLTLAPIFLWGALLSGGRWDWRTTTAFVSLHLFLYPAATAFNAAFDRDVGPVAGMERPPGVPKGLAAFAAGLAAAGAVPAAFAGPGFLLLYALIVSWSFAYSHPRTRWKASPSKSALAIALGQGALGFVAGWAAAAPVAPVETLVLGALGAAATALGLYPATQVFQVPEDEARGDRTLAVALGAAAALRLGALFLIVGGAANVWLVARIFGPPDAALIGIGYAALLVAQLRLAIFAWGVFEEALYTPAMRLLNASTAGFLLFIALEAVGSG